MRALAIVGVLVGHGRDMLAPGRPWAIGLQVFGELGVESFFVLSGFLVGGMLLREAGAPGYSALGFLRRRWWRTLPNYYLALIVWAVMAPSFGANVPGVEFVFFGQTLTGYADAFGISWSLAIEEASYLVLAVAAVFARRRLDRVAWALLLGSTVLRVGVGGDYFDLRQGLLFRLDAVCLGVLVARHRRALARPGLAWLAACIVGVCVGTLAAARVYGGLPVIGQGAGRFLVLHGLQVGVAMLLPRIAVAQAPAWWRYPAQWSYSAYLFHIPVLWLMGLWVPVLGAWAWPVWVAAVFLVSAGIYRGFEAPMTRMRDRPAAWARRTGVAL